MGLLGRGTRPHRTEFGLDAVGLHRAVRWRWREPAVFPLSRLLHEGAVPVLLLNEHEVLCGDPDAHGGSVPHRGAAFRRAGQGHGSQLGWGLHHEVVVCGWARRVSATRCPFRCTVTRAPWFSWDNFGEEFPLTHTRPHNNEQKE